MKKIVFVLLLCASSIFTLKSADEEQKITLQQALALELMQEFQDEAQKISSTSKKPSDTTLVKKHRRSSFAFLGFSRSKNEK